MGLLLTQIRGVRSSLDQVAQSTTRYAGFAFADAFAPGGRFGEPPMRGGALLVHVNNLRDLVASSGVAGFFEGLFGGIGRFFGGLFGGLIGGTIAGIALPVMIWKIDSIVTSLRDILERVGIGGAAGAAAAETPPSPTASVGGEPLVDQIGEFREILTLLTALFETPAAGTPAAERVEASMTPRHERWMTMLRSVENVVAGVTRIVDGLILLVPILIGSVALLLDKLDAIKLAFVRMLQFIVRNVMLLRGVVLVTVGDMLAVSARLAAGLVLVVGRLVQGLLTSLFDIAGTVLQGALAVFQFLAGGLQRVVNGMLSWVVDTLFVVLARFGDLRVFRLIAHLIQVIPSVLPPLFELVRGTPMDPAQVTALQGVANLRLPDPAFPSGALPSSLISPMPDPASLAIPPAELAELRTQMDTLRDGLLRGVGDLSGTVATGFSTMADSFNTLIRDELDRSQGSYATNLETVRERSAEFAGAFAAAERAVRTRPHTGLEAIATAYEQWLTGSGMTTLLDQITQHFSNTPASADRSIPGLVVGERVPPARASIEIQEVIIDLTPPDGDEAAGAARDSESAEHLYAQLLAYQRELEIRGTDEAALLPIR